MHVSFARVWNFITCLKHTQAPNCSLIIVPYSFFGKKCRSMFMYISLQICIMLSYSFFKIFSQWLQSVFKLDKFASLKLISSDSGRCFNTSLRNTPLPYFLKIATFTPLIFLLKSQNIPRIRVKAGVAQQIPCPARMP